MPAVTCFVAEMEVKNAFNGKIGRGIACHRARSTSSTIVAGPSASFSVPSFVILFYIFNSAISSISSERLPAQLVAILPERHSHFTERKRKIPHQLRDIHTYGVLAQSFFTYSMADLYACSLPCSTFNRFFLSFSFLYARAHTFGGLLLVWLTGIEKGKSSLFLLQFRMTDGCLDSLGYSSSVLG